LAHFRGPDVREERQREALDLQVGGGEVLFQRVRDQDRQFGRLVEQHRRRDVAKPIVNARDAHVKRPPFGLNRNVSPKYHEIKLDFPIP
jgi:hypothetical protein